MAGFSEGFAQGFGLVDAAMQRRQQNALAQQQAEQNDAYRQAVLNRQTGIDQRDQTWHNEEQAAAARKEAFDREKFGHEVFKDNKTLGLKESEQASEAAYRKNAADTALMNARTVQFNARANADEGQARADYQRLQMRNLQAQTDKQNALDRLKPFLRVDQATGAVSPINVPAENLPGFINDARIGLGVDLGRWAKDFPKHQANVELLKSAVMQPQLFNANKQRVLDALNDLEAVDINKDYGNANAGQKRITDVLYHPPEQGYPEGFFTFEAEVNGMDAQGRPTVSRGPVTEFRSSNPADQNVRRVTPSQLVRRVDGYDALGQLLVANPQALEQINNALATERKPEKNYLRADVGNEYGEKTTQYIDPDSGNVIDANGFITNPRAEAEALRANSPQRRAQPNAQPRAQGETIIRTATNEPPKLNAAEIARMTPDQRRAFLQARQRQQGQ